MSFVILPVAPDKESESQRGHLWDDQPNFLVEVALSLDLPNNKQQHSGSPSECK